jgi:hypothetical protein
MTPFVKGIHYSSEYDKQDAKEDQPDQLAAAFSLCVLGASEAEYGGNLGDP